MNNSIITGNRFNFDSLVPAVLDSLNGNLSKLQYMSTYNQWKIWCRDNDVLPQDLNPGNVKLFLQNLTTKTGRPVSVSTRSNKLAHIRKYVLLLKILAPEMTQLYDALCYMKVPKDNAGKQHRDTDNISLTDIRKISKYLKQGANLIDIRNRLVFELGLSTGLRREEMANLKWSDINFDDEVIHVRHGKGDKERYVAIIPGTTIDAIHTLLILQVEFGSGIEYVFPPMYQGEPKESRHLTADSIGNIIEDIRSGSGIYFTHHTLRRTHLTEMYRVNKDISELRQQSGHSNIETLFKHYVKGSSAADRREGWKKARW